MFTVFLNHHAKSGTLSFSEFCDLVQNPTNEPKENLRLLLATTCITVRKNEAIDAVNAQFGALVLDIDKSQKPMLDCLAELQGLQVAAYTTSSHKPEANSHSYRIVLPLSSPISADQYEIMQGNLTALFNADQAMASKAQGFYEPSNNHIGYQHAIQQGQCIDNSELWRDLVASAAQPEHERSKPMQLISTGSASLEPLEPLDVTKQRALGTLAQMNPDCSYIDWVTIGASIKSLWGADEGYSIWRKWSSNGTGYLQGDCNTLEKLKRKFDTFKTDNVTIATLFHMAKQQGISVLPSEQFLQQQALDGFDSLEGGIVWKTTFKNGSPKNTEDNLLRLLDYHGITCHYNIIRKKNEITIPNSRSIAELRDDVSISKIKSLASDVDLSINNTGEYLDLIASQKEYNPVLEFINSKEWDGVSRISDFLATITPIDPIPLSNGKMLHEELILKWLMQAVAVGLGYSQAAALGCLTLQGAQGRGKTEWFKQLLPLSHRAELVKTEMSLRLDDKDTILACTTSWIVELGELETTFNKSKAGDLKRFLTTDRDTIRAPYGRANRDNKRMAVFGASVNSSTFLVDETGNRRYWTIAVKTINAMHGIDMQQLWAEVKTILDSTSGTGSQKFALCKEAAVALESVNSSHMQQEQLEDLLDKIDWQSTEKVSITGAELYEQLTGVKGRIHASQLSKLKTMLEQRGIIQKRINSARVYIMPPLKNDFNHITNDQDTAVLNEFN